MAFTEFYMQTTGSNLNAGSTNTDAATLTYAGGTFVRATGVFTVASGNPLSDGLAVGNWASVYTTSGATAATYIAQVTARDATTVTLDLTIKYGTISNVSETAAATTLKTGGAWSDFGMVASGMALTTGTVPVSTRINVKAGTYASTTTTRTCALAGSATNALVWRGYNSTIGDLDADFTTAKPSITFTSGTFSYTGTLATLQNLSLIATTATSRTLNLGAAAIKVVRCRVESSSASAAAYAVTAGSGGAVLIDCWLKATSTATQVVLASNSLGMEGCFITGGGHGVNVNSSTFYAKSCIFNTCGTDGVNYNTITSLCIIADCTFYNCGSDGIEFVTIPASTNVSSVTGNIFSNNTGYGINQSSGTNTNNILLSHNLYYSNGGTTTGFGDTVQFAGQTDSSSPFVTAGTDFTPATGSNARGNNLPGLFENSSTTGYLDIGAVQRQVTAGSAGMTLI